MTREEAIHELQNCKGLIQQDGQDYLDERDIPLIDMAIKALSAIVENKCEWVSCDEEMPIDSQEVIASVYWTNYGDTIFAYGHYNARFDKWKLYSDSEGELIKGYEVVAWLPLPTPYREREEE